ncbi:hypothetical protein [Lactococcus garvieae]|uniref:hypothetical protein n=1 Tax=Lactococcus garvieae TaxID=1363 RepID=UPI0022E3D1C3|nr:hypothetical protein [Lactococcus garvieae]
MSKDTARQEVEQVCFAFEKAGKTGNKKDWGKFYDLEEPLIKKVEFANQPKLSIPKKIAEELEELTGKTNWESTPYSVIEEKGKINTWAYLGHGKCSEQLYKFCRDNTRLMHAYLNPLTRPFVEVTDE